MTLENMAGIFKEFCRDYLKAKGDLTAEKERVEREIKRARDQQVAKEALKRSYQHTTRLFESVFMLVFCSIRTSVSLHRRKNAPKSATGHSRPHSGTRAAPQSTPVHTRPPASAEPANTAPPSTANPDQEPKGREARPTIIENNIAKLKTKDKTTWRNYISSRRNTPGGKGKKMGYSTLRLARPVD